MSLKARMERELQQCQYDYEEHPVFAARLKRRIHLLEFVLSGRYSRMHKRARLLRHLQVSHKLKPFDGLKHSELIEMHIRQGQHLDNEHEEFRNFR